MEKGAHVVARTGRGTVAIANDAVAQVVGHVAAESYGVVGQKPRRGLTRLRRARPTDGVAVAAGEGGLEIDLVLVVEYGLNLAEVASTVRTRVAYEVERVTGLPVAAVEVRIDDARRSG